MAKRIREVSIDDSNPYEWAVYVDPEFDSEISKLKGINRPKRIVSFGCLILTPDPRYDWDELKKEIIELCR